MTNTDSNFEEATGRVMGMGLDLSNPDSITTEERETFARHFERFLGRAHVGHEFWLNHDRPGVLKRYRLFTDAINPSTPTQPFDPNGPGFVAMYALMGYEPGVKYTVHACQKVGLTRSEILEMLAVAYIWIGPRGMETVANALKDYEWVEPERSLRLPRGWGPNPDAFTSGLDFSTPTMTEGELADLREWYSRTEGEIPRYVQFLGQHRPELLKGYRNRFESALRELPIQTMPYAMIHFNVGRGNGPGIREGVLLARGFGMTKEEVFQAIGWGALYGGMEAVTIADEAVGDAFSAWPSRDGRRNVENS